MSDSSDSDSNYPPNRTRVKRLARRNGRISNSLVVDESDSDSSIDVVNVRRKKRKFNIDSDSNSGSDVVQPKRRTARIATSESGSEDESDPGFEGSSSNYETQSEAEAASAVPKDTGVDSDSSDGRSEKCPICLLSFKLQEVASPESCQHLFCLECILEWSKNINTCPVDRQEYKKLFVRQKIEEEVYKSVDINPPSPQVEEAEANEDPTFCEICQLSDREDRMLLCDGCDLGHHLECLTPALSQIPSGSWFCPACVEAGVNTREREIDALELQSLLEDMQQIITPDFFSNFPYETIHGIAVRGNRRHSEFRLVPRTRQSERVRNQIAQNRLHHEPSNNEPSTSQSVSASNQRSTLSRRPITKRKKRKRKVQRRFRTVYKIDPKTGETITLKKRIKRRRKKRKQTKITPIPKTVKGRIAQQLGICRINSVPQSIPEFRATQPTSSINHQRHQAGVPGLAIFEPRDDMVLFSDSENEFEEGGVLLRRRAPNRSDVAVLRRNRVKNAPIITSTTSINILDSILDEQTRFYSKRRLDLNLVQPSVRKCTNYNETSTDSQPSSSRNDTSSPDRANSTPSSTVTSNSVANQAESTDSRQRQELPVDSFDYTDDKQQKTNDSSHSESELDIYSDIETVSTSKIDEGEVKPTPSPGPTPNDSDCNDSENDLVIDTEKSNAEENTKEETTVTSTVDSNEIQSQPELVTSSHCAEIQSEAIQSTSSQPYNEELEKKEDSEEDECPNFSIYSTETMNMAKATDITLNKETNQSEEVSSSPAPSKSIKISTSLFKPDSEINQNLYSDSEDETVIKRDTFAISDLRNMTEDISEDERSYTPCLDERNEGLEGLDTEMISDEERNEFDESHELKAVSDNGEALEINAKESELDFSRPEDYEEGEIVDKNKKKATEEDETKNEDEKENTAQTKEPFKKLSKSTKERNYRDKDRDKERSRSKSREKLKPKRDRKREKRKEMERYNVRAIISVKPRAAKDKFGRDIRRSSSKTKSESPKRSPSPKKRSVSKSRRSTSRHRSKSKSRKRRTKSPKAKKRKRSPSREKRRKEEHLKEDRTKEKQKGSRSRRSSSPKRPEWRRRESWSLSPELKAASPSWTPPRLDKPQNLTVILKNDKKKKEKKRKIDKKKENSEKSKKRKRDRTPSKEVFASGDNILVSVSFNKESENTRDITSKRQPTEVNTEELAKKQKKKFPRPKRILPSKEAVANIKPVAIIDLEKSPFKELTPSPKDVIVLSDSDTEDKKCELVNPLLGPKTPPEPQIKFTVTAATVKMRPILNPLHDPNEVEEEDQPADTIEEHIGPNTPPDPPTSAPSSPDAYDPFEPTKSGSNTPNQVIENKVEEKSEKAEEIVVVVKTPEKSHTPPILPDVQPADSQSSIHATPDSDKSPEPPVVPLALPSLPLPLLPTPNNSIVSSAARINILNNTILAQTGIPPRAPSTKQLVLSKGALKVVRKMSGHADASTTGEPNLSLDSPYSPGSSDYEDLFEPPLENVETPQQPTPTSAMTATGSGGKMMVTKASVKSVVKSPNKVQNTFDALFGTSPLNKIKTSNTKGDKAKYSGKKSSGKGRKEVKLDEDNFKILDDLPNSAVEMQVKDKFLKKLNRQERVVDEVKLVLKPHYNKKHVTKEEYKDILRRAVPKICHNKSGEINPTKIKNLIEAYVKRVRHSKKVTSSSSVNPQKN